MLIYHPELPNLNHFAVFASDFLFRNKVYQSRLDPPCAPPHPILSSPFRGNHYPEVVSVSFLLMFVLLFKLMYS